jgi:hypothetical protein
VSERMAEDRPGRRLSPDELAEVRAAVAENLPGMGLVAFLVGHIDASEAEKDREIERLKAREIEGQCRVADRERIIREKDEALKALADVVEGVWRSDRDEDGNPLVSRHALPQIEELLKDLGRLP